MEQKKKKFSIPISKKVKRIILWIVGIVVGLYLLLLTGLSIYVSSSKERLVGFIKGQISKTILGELKITSADITVWRSFPKIGLTLQNVAISDSFYHKPFLRAEALTAKVGLLDLLGNKVTINSVSLANAQVHIFTDAKGYSNAYVFSTKSPEIKEENKDKKPFVLSNLNLENVTVLIEDIPKNKRYQARIDEAEMEMKLTGSKYKITFDEDLTLRGLGFKMSQGYWLENQRIEADWKLVFDTAGSVLSIQKSAVKIQGQPFDIDGEFNFGKSQFNLNAVTKDIVYAVALNMLKPKTRIILQKLNFSKPLDATVALTGSLKNQGDPVVKVSFSTTDNDLVTPVLNFNNCTFSGTYNNQYNTAILPDDSNSTVRINTFVSKWGDVALKGKDIAITNFTKPVVHFEFFSACTLQQLDEALGSSTLNFEEGNAKLYVAYNGPLIADPSLLNRVDAKAAIHNGKIVYVPRNITFSNCEGGVSISGNNLLMKDFKCAVNTNKFVVNIKGDGLSRFSASEGDKGNITCDVFTPALDLADFKSVFGNKTTGVKKKSKSLKGTGDAIDNALENGNLYVNIKASQVILDHFLAKNVVANVFFKDNDWAIKKASLQHADGNFNLTAKIHEISNGYHSASTQIDLQHINVKKLFYAFDNFGQKSITANNLKGTLDAKANIVSNINSAGKFVPESMNGNINFLLKNAALIKMDALMNIQQFIFKNRNLENVEFAKVQNNFKLQNGDIIIPRMPVQSSAITMYIEGKYSFADRTDISIQIPFSSLKSKPEDFKNIDVDKMNDPGSSIFLRAQDKDGQVKIGLDLFKRYQKKQRREEKRAERNNKD